MWELECNPKQTTQNKDEDNKNLLTILRASSGSIKNRTNIITT